MFDSLTLSLVKTLEKRTGVCDVRLTDKGPAERHQIMTWEQSNSCILPDDIKRFYMTTNGFLLQWSVNFTGQVLVVGRLEINSLSSLKRQSDAVGNSSYSLRDLDSDNEEVAETGGEMITKPSFDSHTRIFEIDPCEGYGKVCLVYKSIKPGSTAQNPEIWFLDRSLRWHFLSQTFTQYYRIMLMHLGLPQWQYALTDIGLSPQAKQWFNMISPVRLAVDESARIKSRTTDQEAILDIRVNKLDPTKVFRGKTKSKDGQQKKKASQTSGRVSGNKSASSQSSPGPSKSK